MKKYAPVILILALLLGGCAEVNVVTIRSLENEKDVYKGREISYKRDKEADSEIEIDAVRKGKIYFYVYIKNNSGSRMEINPEELFIKTYFTRKDLDEGNGIKYRAIDPEKKLDEIDLEYEKSEESRDFAIGLNCCFSFFNFAAHVSDDDYTAFEAAEDVAGFAVRHEAIEDNYGNKINDLNSNREFWRKEVLRRTVLNPGEGVGGIVVMPLPSGTSFIRVHIPFEKSEHTYLFELKSRKRR